MEQQEVLVEGPGGEGDEIVERGDKERMKNQSNKDRGE
jgi:hypothetical protein